MFAWTKLWRRGRDRRTRSVEALSRAIVAVVEGMEARRLFATTCTPSGGLWTVDGDSNANKLEVLSSGSNIIIEEDDVQVCTRAQSLISSIVVNGLNGDDQICIHAIPTTIAVTMNGGAGADLLEGGDGGETINGEGGNDVIHGNAGADSLSGGSDSDTFYGYNADGADTISGGDQLDTVDYGAKTGNLTITVGSGANDGASGEGDDVQGDIETVIGGQGNDHITGDSSDELLDGYYGNDTLVGGTGTSADTLNGGSGTGTDTADYSARSDNLKITLDGVNNDGNETFGEGDNVVDVQIVIGGSGNDTIIGDGGANTLMGSGGTDSLRGGDNADSIDGGSGNDTIYGDDGNDTLKAGGGTDTIYGGNDNDHIYGYGVLYGEAGNDNFFAFNGFKDTIDGGSGTDTLWNHDGDDLDLLTNVETII